MGRMLQAGSCERRGSTLVFHDEDGIRHAVRVSAIIAASDADAIGNATVVQLPGGRFVVVRTCLEEVIQWMAGPPPAPVQASPGSHDPNMLRAPAGLEAPRAAAAHDGRPHGGGVLPSRVFRDMRKSCVEFARAFASDGSAQVTRRAFFAPGQLHSAPTTCVLPRMKNGSGKGVGRQPSPSSRNVTKRTSSGTNTLRVVKATR